MTNKKIHESTNAFNIFSLMFEKDAFSNWLGITLKQIEPGKCKLEMKVRQEMLNGFGILHGGIAYSLADSALAFASNAQGRKAISLETSISHLLTVSNEELITAQATEEFSNHRIGLYRVEVKNSEQKLVALFKGTVYLKKESW